MGYYPSKANLGILDACQTYQLTLHALTRELPVVCGVTVTVVADPRDLYYTGTRVSALCENYQANARRVARTNIHASGPSLGSLT